MSEETSKPETVETVAPLDVASQPQQPIDKNITKDANATSNESSHNEKLGIYKALAIKLKKELLKTREELNKLKDDYRQEVSRLQSQVEILDKTLESERVICINTDVTHQATIKNLRSQLEVAENELQSLQKDFDDYKIRATKLLQQYNVTQPSRNQLFEEERIAQLENLSGAQNEQINLLTSKIKAMSAESDKLGCEITAVNHKLELARNRVSTLEEKNNVLTSENESLRSKIEQMNTETDDRHRLDKPGKRAEKLLAHTDSDIDIVERRGQLDADNEDPALEECNTNSNSSVDSSTSGYVHIKPTTFEIISRSSVLEDAQNQIDHLTKAYLDSENTNSLLSEQVVALKEEIRRIQRGNDRMELVNNLEYLKNILFKFLSLDNSQVEQRRRLIPVLSTVLKLSPEEASRLK